jgi:hypothetical protein
MKQTTSAARRNSSPGRSSSPGTAGIPERLPIIAVDMPVMFEDEGQEEMGETDVHTLSTAIIFWGLKAHLAARPEYRVFSDLNCYYHPVKRWAYVSPDVMVVAPRTTLPEAVASYRIGETRPAPLLVVEVLSRRSFQQQDLTNKPEIYADLGVAEYVLADTTGQFLIEKLLLKRLQADVVWKDAQDVDGGVTSRLGFRVVIEHDGQLRVLDVETGKRYARPNEAQAALDQVAAEADARRRAEEQVRALEEELAKLRGKPSAKPEAKRKRRKP